MQKFIPQLKGLLKGCHILTCCKCDQPSLQYNHFARGWECLEKGCGYRTREIPEPQYFERILELKQMLEDLKFLTEVSELMDAEEAERED